MALHSSGMKSKQKELKSFERQKFISLVVDENYTFKKRQYKWAATINKAIGAQKLNLQLGQIKIDGKKLTDFINEMTRSEKEKRPIIIKRYFN